MIEENYYIPSQLINYQLIKTMDAKMNIEITFLPHLTIHQLTHLLKHGNNKTI